MKMLSKKEAEIILLHYIADHLSEGSYLSREPMVRKYLDDYYPKDAAPNYSQISDINKMLAAAASSVSSRIRRIAAAEEEKRFRQTRQPKHVLRAIRRRKG